MTPEQTLQRIEQDEQKFKAIQRLMTPVPAPVVSQEPQEFITPEPTPFEQRAAILIARGIPVAPLPPRNKVASLTDWQNLATTDVTKLAALNPDHDGNTAAVARAEIGGYCFFEVDAPNFHLEIEKQTGQKFPETFLVSSTPGKGRGHFY